MRIFIGSLTLGLLVLCLGSCNESSSSGPANSIPSFTFHSSHCVGSALAKAEIPDSTFVYSFSDTLAVDFSVSGNCCPDSGRFEVSHAVGVDTLVISVVDTADYGCRCLCTYFLHAEIVNLPNNHYVVRCRLVNIESPGLSRDPIYLVDVYRP